MFTAAQIIIISLAILLALAPIAAGVLCVIFRIPLAPCAADFIPATDLGLTTWSANFESGIDTEYATYGLTSGQATAYTALDTAYQAAYTAATDPGTRTPVTIAAKDTARTALVANARFLAAIVNAYPGTTNMGRATLGLNPRGDTPTPVPTPTTKPLPVVLRYNPLQHVLQIRDVTTPTSRAKPFGSVGAQVFVKVGTPAPADISECVLKGIYTKPFLPVDFDSADAGKLAHYITRWITRRGLTGPSSDIITATVPAA